MYNDEIKESEDFNYVEEDATVEEIGGCGFCGQDVADDPDVDDSPKRGLITKAKDPKKTQKSSVTQWSDVDGKIIAVSNTFERLDKGYYSIHASNTLGMYFVKEEIELNKLYRLPNEASDLVLNDISKFWTLEETYKKYNRVFRRNYLLYSAPGTGKTSLINLMCKELIDLYDGIVFSLTTEHEIEMLPDAVKRIKKIEPDRKIIAIIEDIDTFTQSSSSFNTLLLNILDGNYKLGNMVTIATTNHIEYLEERYVNRPSRFDRVVEFPLPNAESRRMFIEYSVLPEDLEKIDINHWVERTENYTIDHINELILLHFVFGHTEEEAFNTVDSMVKRSGVKLKNKTSLNKKTIGF